MDKVNIGKQGYTLPMPQAILGTHYEDHPNYMALGWASRVNYKPALIGIGINKGHASHQAILQTNEFSINFPTVEMVKKTDYVGLVSAKRTDKSAVFDCFYGELKKAPLIRECPLSLECRVYKIVDLPTNSFIIGEIVGTWCEERYMTDNSPDIEKISPFVLTMPDNRYWEIGRCVGYAWKDGKALKQK